MKTPFAITLDVGSSLLNKTGSWRNERPVYVDRLPPCNNACPAGENIQQWLYHAEEGDYRRAFEEIMRNNPLPAIMGRACYHPCETSCNRASLDQAVNIHAVERFLGDQALREGWRVEVTAPASGRRVLVIGAGPSGLSAAYLACHHTRSQPSLCGSLQRPRCLSTERLKQAIQLIGISQPLQIQVGNLITHFLCPTSL